MYKEIGLMAELGSCPHVLSLVGAEVTPGEEEAYVLMEYCQQDLATFLRAQPRPLARAVVLDVFESVCLAVQAMHRLTPPTAHR